MDATRRGLIAGGAAALLLARPAAAKNVGDAAVLAGILEVEQALVYLYQSDHLPAGLAQHEAEHAAAIDTQLEAAGGTKPAPVTTEQELDARLEVLGVQRSSDVVELAVALEEKAVSLYTDAAGKLEDLRLIQTCASIVAAEGQHLVVLRELLDQDPVPRAIETGS